MVLKLVTRVGLGVAATVGFLVVVVAGVISWFGLWNIVFPSHSFETVPPEIDAAFGNGARLRVLSFSKTNSFRHDDGIEGARALFDRLAAKREWAVFHSENSAVFNSQHLSRFDVIVFSNASGDVLSDEQESAFAAWLEGGGGWVGIHAAGDASHQEWKWYQETLIGGLFTMHIMGPSIQEARVIVEDREHPATRGLPVEFRHAEEWYSWDASARTEGFDVLLSVDESSYEPFFRGFGQERDLRMGDHPVVWSRCVGRGRALYAALGHWGEAYSNPYYALLLENSIEWAAGVTGDECGE